eukprot:scaffold2637_cov107-Isochrysis_galbana.AAC.1
MGRGAAGHDVFCDGPVCSPHGALTCRRRLAWAACLGRGHGRTAFHIIPSHPALCRRNRRFLHQSQRATPPPLKQNPYTRAVGTASHYISLYQAPPLALSR